MRNLFPFSLSPIFTCPAFILTLSLLSGVLLSGCSKSDESKIARAHSRCLERFKSEVSKVAQSIPTAKQGDPAGALAQGMGQAMTGMVGGVGVTMCDSMRDQCKQDFGGEVCKSFINSFQ